MMKNYIKFLLRTSVLCFLVSSQVVAADQVVENKTNIVRVGYCDEYKTVTTLYDGTVEGFAVDYFTELSKYTGDTYEFVHCDWEDAFTLLESGDIDVFGPLSYTEERDELYSYTDASFGKEGVYLASLQVDGFEYDDYNEIASQMIGVCTNDANRTLLDLFCVEHEIAPQIIEIDEQSLDSTSPHTMIVISAMQYEQQYEVVAELGYENVYYITRDEDIELSDGINDGLEKIQSKNPMFYEELINEYYPSVTYGKVHISNEEIALLQSKELYRVGYYVDHVPFSYLDTEGNPSGIAISVMDEIAQAAEINIEYVPMYKDGSEYQNIDINLSILTSMELSYHSDRCDPYMELPLMVIGYYDNLSYENASIGYMDYIGLEVEQLQSYLPGSDLILFHSIENIIDNLKTNKIDYAITTNLMSKQILEATDSEQSIARTFGVDCLVSFSLADEISDTMGPIFDKYISRIDQQDLYTRVIASSYDTALELDVPLFIFEHYYEILMTLLILIILAACIIIFNEIKRRKQLLHIIEVDDLTGLMTEIKFMEECEKRLTKTSVQYVLVAIDIDNFKYINEAYGYTLGSELLQEFAKELQASYDNDDLIARTYADNFLVLTTQKDDGCAFCGKASCEFCELSSVATLIGEDYRLNISVGAYIIEDAILDLSYMMDCANVARSLSKGIYGTIVTVYSSSMEKSVHIQNDIIRTMEQALENREFKVVYQPKIDLQTGEVCGAEALVRWVRDDFSMVYPDQFIPVFEKNGFIAKLDFYMLSRVCEFISMNNPPNMPKISVNLSGVTMLENDLAAKILAIVHSYNVAPSSLELEITESAIIDNFKEATSTIEELIALGFTLSMDDFGTGISSLNRLKDINVHILKIDREFLVRALEDKKGVLIIGNIIRMARQLGIQSIAEGVETREQLELLGNLGCDMGQGYYFAKPLSEDDYRNFLDAYDGSGNCVKEEAIIESSKAKQIGETNIASLIMDAADNIIYIADIVSYELYYISHATEVMLGGLKEKDWKGKKCYEVLQGKSEPCEFCTNHLLNEESFYQWEHFNPIGERYYSLQDKLIQMENRLVRLEIATDITERANLEYEIKDKLVEQQVLNSCVELLHASDMKIAAAVDELLRIVSEYYEAERGYIFAISEDRKYLNNTYEWCAEGIDPQIDILQGVDIHVCDHWFEMFEQVGEFYIDSINDEVDPNSEEFRILDSQGIQSLVTAPLRDDCGGFSGFMGVDNPKKNTKNTMLIRSVTKFIDAFFDRNELIEELNKLSFIDGLTGLMNRYSYEKDLKRMAKENLSTMGVAYIDINGLKIINDTQGHEAGDRAIVSCAEIIQNTFDFHTYRIGGDEFVILCPNMKKAEFDSKIEKLKSAMAKNIEADASIGSVWSKEFYHVLLLVREADKLMYIEKEKSRTKGIY